MLFRYHAGRTHAACLCVHAQPVRAGVEPAPATGAALNNAAAAAAAAIEAMEDVDDACVHACKSTRLLLCSLAVHPRSVDARASGYAEAVVSVDNYTSKAHTVLQVRVAIPRLLPHAKADSLGTRFARATGKGCCTTACVLPRT